MKIYNTLSRKLEEFKPITEGKVLMYGCGVTPYKPSHLGHALQGIVFDVFRRYFEYRDYEVTYVRNYTDIDDKIINVAKEQGIHPLELSRKVMAQCDEDFEDLRVRRADFEPKVSEHIAEIIKTSQELIDKGYAYATIKGNVYFSVRRFKDYGKLSHQKIEDLQHGTRKEVEEDKQDLLDFALWKSADKSERFWESPWGHGRPGWHIECSVMSSHFLGSHFDIHGGGGDLIFPHHENEIAQSESIHGAFANYWIHNGLLMVGKDKMSKSLNNDVSIRDWLNKYHPEVIRYLILTNHYRSHVQFISERYSDANKKVYQVYKTLSRAVKEFGYETSVNNTAKEKLLNEFESYMDNDFNTVQVVAMFHRLVKEINSALDSKKDMELIKTNYEVIQEIGKIIGLFDLTPWSVLGKIKELEAKNRNVDLDSIESLITERQKSRSIKDFIAADKITKELVDCGINLIDTKSGTEWEFSYRH